MLGWVKLGLSWGCDKIKIVENDSNGLKWFEIVQMDQNCSEKTKRVKKVQKSFKWSEWLEIIQNS